MTEREKRARKEVKKEARRARRVRIATEIIRLAANVVSLFTGRRR